MADYLTNGRRYLLDVGFDAGLGWCYALTFQDCSEFNTTMYLCWSRHFDGLIYIYIGRVVLLTTEADYSINTY